MSIPLFYDDRNIYWVFDTFGKERVEEYLHSGKFDTNHINEVMEVSSNPYWPTYDRVLTQLVLPHVDLNKNPKIVQDFLYPSGVGVREYVLEHAPHQSSVIGPSFNTVDPRIWMLMWDLDNISQYTAKGFDAAGAIDVLADDDVFERTLQNVSRPEMFTPILFNAVYSPWSTLEHLATVLKYAPEDILQERLAELICDAARKTDLLWPNAQQRCAEHMVGALLPYVKDSVLDEWVKNDHMAAEIIKLYQDPDRPFKAHDPDVKLRHSFDGFDQAYNDSRVRTGGHYPCSPGEYAKTDPIADRKELRQERIDEIVSVIAEIYEHKGIAGVQDAINSQQLTSEHINAGLYHALNNGIPMLANIALKHIDWDNQFAKESLRLALGATSSNSKQAMVQQMIVKKEAQELNGRLSATIAHIVEQNTTAHTRKM